MDQPYASPYPPPQFVMMPVSQRNGLGLFAFLVALIGLFIPTGVIALLGLVLSLAAIGRSPRGFATMGVILGLLGTVFWLGVMLMAFLIGVVALIAVALVAVGAFLLTQPEVVEITTDMVNVALAAETYQQDHDGLPTEIGALALGVATTIDPWGETYRFEIADDDPGFDIVSSGPDCALGTDDDVRLSRLDRFWESAFENFDAKMEEFGRKLESLEHMEHRYGSCRPDEPGPRPTGPDYEHAARSQITAESGGVPGPPPAGDAPRTPDGPGT